MCRILDAASSRGGAGAAKIDVFLNDEGDALGAEDGIAKVRALLNLGIMNWNASLLILPSCRGSPASVDCVSRWRMC